ncbi:MAG: sugar transferase [Streptococcaceae bacterium]|jgi:O-antigen biosynthesis protein WbqP|nr:sugar transferase [Streptococcaceae bacterium]MCH4176946.1 sugar transferase [Streptococcaceae bacterium]
MYEKYIKRIFDFSMSLIGLVVLFPFFVVIALAVKFDSKGLIIFKQKRIGRDKRYFYIYKFRTMYSETPKNMATHLIEQPDVYITKVGKILRKTSLDELPQLLNILKGDMAVIGPRPALWNQYDLISERDRVGANSVRPGLTGLAQISGRDELSVVDKAKLDGEYVKNITLWLDFKCFFKTIISVIKKDGVVEGGTAENKK